MEKLYYQDCHMRTFSARVTGCQAADGGYWVTLDATAFYPEGGGQACDLGTLGDARVLDVRERADTVCHLCDRPLPVGDTVTGQIDWARRFDLMQQHTGEHIVSGLVHAQFGFHNVGFHVGAAVMEVDFDGPIPPQALEQIELRANQAVWEDIPVLCQVPDPQALAQTVYRTKRPLPWPVRIVRIPGYDSCACCGVHVARTGEIGLIKILSCVKFHEGVRLEMVCGQRAYRYMAALFGQNRLVSQAFSVPPEQTGDAARRMNEALAQQKLRCARWQKAAFAAMGREAAGQENVLRFEEALDGGEVRLLATEIARSCHGWAAVFSGREGEYRYCIAARGQDLRPMGRAMTQALRGRGGGSAEFQQGTVQAAQAEIQAFFAQET